MKQTPHFMPAIPLFSFQNRNPQILFVRTIVTTKLTIVLEVVVAVGTGLADSPETVGMVC